MKFQCGMALRIARLTRPTPTRDKIDDGGDAHLCGKLELTTQNTGQMVPYLWGHISAKHKARHRANTTNDEQIEQTRLARDRNKHDIKKKKCRLCRTSAPFEGKATRTSASWGAQQARFIPSLNRHCTASFSGRTFTIYSKSCP